MEQNYANKFSQLRKLYKYIKSPCYIAGGCIKDTFDGNKPHDIDIYFKCQKEYKDTLEKYEWDSNYEKCYSTVNVEAFTDISTGVTVELVKGFFFEPEELFEESFDFGVDMFALVCEENPDKEDEFSVVYNSHFFEDLYTHKLNISNITSPLRTLTRIIKYTQYGYSIDTEELIKVTDELRDLDDFDYLEDLKTINAYDLDIKDRKI